MFTELAANWRGHRVSLWQEIGSGHMMLCVRCGAVACNLLRNSTVVSGVTLGPCWWKWAIHRRLSMAFVCVAEDTRAEGSVTGSAPDVAILVRGGNGAVCES